MNYCDVIVAAVLDTHDAPPTSEVSWLAIVDPYTKHK